MSAPPAKGGDSSRSAIEALNDMIDQYTEDGVVDFESDSSDALFEAVARYANNNKPLPSTPEDIQKLLQSMPLTATHMPAPGEESDAFKGLQAMIDEVPIESRMYNYKESGNRSYKLAVRLAEPRPNETAVDRARRFETRRNKLHEAHSFYTQALLVAPEGDDKEPELKATLYLNRAQVQSTLENYGYCVRDCEKSLKLRPDSAKAFYRAAFALFKLHKYPQSFLLLRQGLTLPTVTKGSSEQKQFIALAKKVLPAWKRVDDAEHARAAKRAADKAEADAKQALLDAALAKRGLVVGPAQFTGAVGQYDAKPYLNASDKAVHWPVVFLYPAEGQSDYFADVSEDATVGELIKKLFSEPAPWDADRAYTPATVEVYCNVPAAAGAASGTTTAAAAAAAEGEEVRVDVEGKNTVKVTVAQSSTLGHALKALTKRGYVIPEVPTFCVRVRGK